MPGGTWTPVRKLSLRSQRKKEVSKFMLKSVGKTALWDTS